MASISPANNATSVPLNAQVVVHFSEPIDPDVVNGVFQLTPTGGGSPVAGTVTLGSDMVTLYFVPSGYLQVGTQYTVQVSGYQDMAGNTGVPFTSTFTTAASSAVINVSTGLDASGNVITTGGTVDPHWMVTPSGSFTPQPAMVVAPGQPSWSSNWNSYGYADGPKASVITLNPNAGAGTTDSYYSTTFNLTGQSLTNLCLDGALQGDPYGTLLLNGTAITGQFNPWAGMTPISISLSSANQGVNTLSFQTTSSWDSYEGFRLQAVVETCSASYIGNLSMVSATPSAGSTGVYTNTTITMNFNEALDPATVSSSTLPVMIGWNGNQIVAGNYAVNGSQVVFTPASPFPANTTIYVGNCNGPYSLAGTTYPGCYPVQWDNFTTGSTTSPGTPATPPFQVAVFSPAANASNVGLRAPVYATFNRSFNPNTINPNSASSDFALFAGDGQSPWCTGYWRSQDDLTLGFNCGPLPSSAIMTAVLNSDLQDWQGNGLANFTSQFTTSQYDSNTNGTIISYRPGNGAAASTRTCPSFCSPIFRSTPALPRTALRWRRTTWRFPARYRFWITATPLCLPPARRSRRARSSSGGPRAASRIPLTTHRSMEPPATSMSLPTPLR